eukprot:CAMPEP_0168433396 /NCGR_PEP_ID=MMETSP0228-20121227/39379_1 /TAXON_ID=133427 /ORGANISM="Protoceratium reticulatum, Strain CCCM 535 (=CCMP 1889)" /LENGTH=245 /DNA_ID=CAMNT_0008447541 /DNA_START=39 /DNA_END=776 /DNA_ORIENTATION=+
MAFSPALPGEALQPAAATLRRQQHFSCCLSLGLRATSRWLETADDLSVCNELGSVSAGGVKRVEQALRRQESALSSVGMAVLPEMLVGQEPDGTAPLKSADPDAALHLVVAAPCNGPAAAPGAAAYWFAVQPPAAALHGQETAAVLVAHPTSAVVLQVEAAAAATSWLGLAASHPSDYSSHGWREAETHLLLLKLLEATAPLWHTAVAVALVETALLNVKARRARGTPAICEALGLRIAVDLGLG